MIPDNSLIVGLDIDNTLLDPDGWAYPDTVEEFLGLVDLGLQATERFDAYEELRAAGNAFDRIGLRNASHERGNADALAVLCMIHCANPNLRAELGIKIGDQGPHQSLISELVKLDKATRVGSFDARLDAELHARRFCMTDARVRRFCAEGNRIAEHHRIIEWSEAYRAIELRQVAANQLPIMEALASTGLIPVIVSEGCTDLQLEKLQRVGLAGFSKGRTLVSEALSHPPGCEELDQTVSALIDECLDGARAIDEELSLLWHYHCLINAWAGKTPAFFGRCLHLIQQSPSAPEDALSQTAYVSTRDWEPLHFVMVGDRYDKDIEPLIDLLGPGVGMKIRLRAGKYGHLHPEDELPADRRPDKTFTDFDSLATFLTEELTADQVNPIIRPPDIVNRADVRPDYIERGLTSPYEAVRTVASAVADMMQS